PYPASAMSARGIGRTRAAAAAIATHAIPVTVFAARSCVSLQPSPLWSRDVPAARRRMRRGRSACGSSHARAARPGARGRAAEADLNAQTAGPRADVLVDALLERETIGDRRQEDRGPVACETRGDPDGERLQGDPRAVVARTGSRAAQRVVERRPEVEGTQ